MVAAKIILIVTTWVGALIAITLLLGNEDNYLPERKRFGFSALALLVAVAITVGGGGLVFIEPHEVGVVVSPFQEGGIREHPLPPGAHWVIPVLERVQKYPATRQTATVTGDETVDARTRDGQRIFVDASIVYEIRPAEAVALHKKWQTRYLGDLILPATRSVVRDVVSQYLVDEVVSTHRGDVSDAVARRLSAILLENYIVLVEFFLRDVTFTQEYAQAVEEKRIATERAERARIGIEQKRHEAEQMRQQAQGEADAALIRARAEAEAKIIHAQAQAEALEIIARALQESGDLPQHLLQYLFLENIARGNVPMIIVPADLPVMLPVTAKPQ